MAQLITGMFFKRLYQIIWNFAHPCLASQLWEFNVERIKIRSKLEARLKFKYSSYVFMCIWSKSRLFQNTQIVAFHQIFQNNSDTNFFENIKIIKCKGTLSSWLEHLNCFWSREITVCLLLNALKVICSWSQFVELKLTIVIEMP